MGLTQLLIESSIRPRLFLLESKSNKITGNYLLLRVFINCNQIHWIEKENWKNIEELAQNYSIQQDRKIKIIPEGACMPEALLESITLALDILRNETCLKQIFDHIWWIAAQD